MDEETIKKLRRMAKSTNGLDRVSAIEKLKAAGFSLVAEEAIESTIVEEKAELFPGFKSSGDLITDFLHKLDLVISDHRFDSPLPASSLEASSSKEDEAAAGRLDMRLEKRDWPEYEGDDLEISYYIHPNGEEVCITDKLYEKGYSLYGINEELNGIFSFQGYNWNEREMSGIINSHGKILVKPKYDSIEPCGEYLKVLVENLDDEVEDEEGNEIVRGWGLISRYGKVLINTVYKEIIKEANFCLGCSNNGDTDLINITVEGNPEVLKNIVSAVSWDGNNDWVLVEMNDGVGVFSLSQHRWVKEPTFLSLVQGAFYINGDSRIELILGVSEKKIQVFAKDFKQIEEFPDFIVAYEDGYRENGIFITFDCKFKANWKSKEIRVERIRPLFYQPYSSDIFCGKFYD